MKNRLSAFLCLTPIALACVAMLACAVPALEPTPTEDIGTQVALVLTQTAVAATQTALVEPTATPPPAATPTPTAPAPVPQTGTIMGNLCYPSEGIPPLTVYAQEVVAQQTVSIQTAENQGQYTLEVPAPGTYIVFAYTNFGVGGTYSPAVPCGLTVDCTDHTPIALDIQPGATVSGADICDYYGPPGSIPPNPQPATGTIMGNLCYPSEFVPALVVYAREVNTNQTVSLNTVENQGSYSIVVPAPGTYIVFAWRDGVIGASYSQAVPCGLTVACTDHTPIQLPVASGQAVTGADICDYYGPEGSVPLP